MPTLDVNGTVTGALSVEQTISGEISVEQSVSGVLTIVGDRSTPAYEGDYNVTPSDEAQVLETSGFRMTGDVTINPIPSNYGKISWNGSILTVS